MLANSSGTRRGECNEVAFGCASGKGTRARFARRPTAPSRSALKTIRIPLTAVLLLLSLLLVCRSAALLCLADEETNTYERDEPVKVYANKMGPYNNPMETYGFFNVPGCPPVNLNSKYPSIGHMLTGDEYYEFNASIRFGIPVTRGVVCAFSLGSHDATIWKDMVKERYWYQMRIDGLQVRGAFGKMVSSDAKASAENDEAAEKAGVPHVFTHREFTFGIRDNQIVSAKVRPTEPLPVAGGQVYTFTYSAVFTPSNLTFENRMMDHAHTDEEVFEHRIRWVSLTNSIMLVLFLVGIVFVILTRTLRADFARMDELQRHRDEGREDFHDESGWKQLYADVFRVPPAAALLCAVTGMGVQLLGMISLAATFGAVSAKHASAQRNMVAWMIVIYALTSFFSGYVSAAKFQAFVALNPVIAPNWIPCALMTGVIFPGIVFSAGGAVNVVAMMYGSAEAMHFAGVTAYLFMWLFVSFPLVIAGTLYGRHSNRRQQRKHEQPHINQIPRLVPNPPSKWYRAHYFYPLCGLLPFGSIFIEVYLVFTSFWLYRFYYLYGFLMLVILIFVTVTACVAVTATYLSLNAEDHRWPWRSFACGASSSMFIFAYAVYFYMFKTTMSGFYMFVLYFIYMAVLSIIFALVGGSVGFLAASRFVHHIYQRLKAD